VQIDNVVGEKAGVTNEALDTNIKGTRVSDAGGLAVEQGTDFLTECQAGNVPGYNPPALFQASTEGVGLAADGEKQCWNMPGFLKYFDVETQLYASSTSINDTAVTILIFGVDIDYNSVTRVATLNGNAQVPFSGTSFRTRRAIVIGPNAPEGHVYIAENDTVTGGVPQTQDKIQLKMTQGYNTATNGSISIPNNEEWYLYFSSERMGKQQDIRFSWMTKPFGGVYIREVDYDAYETPYALINTGRNRLPAKTDIEIRVTPGIDNVTAVIGFGFINRAFDPEAPLSAHEINCCMGSF